MMSARLTLVGHLVTSVDEIDLKLLVLGSQIIARAILLRLRDDVSFIVLDFGVSTRCLENILHTSRSSDVDIRDCILDDELVFDYLYLDSSSLRFARGLRGP